MRAWEKNIRQVTPYVPGEQPVSENNRNCYDTWRCNIGRMYR